MGPIKLNLGCGQNRLAGYVNVDREGDADVLWDLEQFPWPWENDSVKEIILRHVLEHLGETTSVYLGIFKEMYRVCRHDALVRITVPHPRHDNFLGDPTHVRAVTYVGLRLFSKEYNLRCKELNWPPNPLGLYLDVDFEVIHGKATLDEQWRKEHPNEDPRHAARYFNNVVSDMYYELRCIKPRPRPG
jgi:predicted SAM-dependent methyltransferase